MTLASIIESILFVHGDPITLKKLAAIAGVPAEQAEAALARLAHEYESRGLALVEKDGAYQMGTAAANTKYIAALARGEFSEDLSRSSLETIAIIAYKGPLASADIEHIRGVNSSYAVRNLLLRGLILREENPRDARSWRYRVSADFLKHLGLKKMEDLPGYEELQKQSAAAFAGIPHE